MARPATVRPDEALRRPRLRRPLQAALDRCFDWLVSAFIVLTVVLPSGSIYGVNLKSPLYLALLPLAAFTFFSRGYATAERVSLLIGVPAVLSGWLIVGVVKGFPLAGAMRQYMDLMLVFLVCWLVQLFCAEERTREVRFLRLVVSSELATGFVKAGIIGYAVVRGVPTVEIVSDISRVFGVTLMTMDLGAMFGRIQFVSDALIPVCLFIILRYRSTLGYGSVRASAMILLLLASVVFSFSRYFWAFAAIAFVLGLWTGRRDRFHLVLSGLLMAVVLASLPALEAVYELRFSGEVAGNSDLIRTEQRSALIAFFEDAPLLGHGLGSYTGQVVRQQETDGGIRYSYEAQILALTGQVGLSGIAFLTVLAAYYFSDLWWQAASRLVDRFALLCLLTVWFAAGLYNPLLLHPVAGIIYASFATLGALARRERPSAGARRVPARVQAGGTAALQA